MGSLKIESPFFSPPVHPRSDNGIVWPENPVDFYTEVHAVGMAGPRQILFYLFAIGFEALRLFKIPIPSELSKLVLGKFQTAGMSFRDLYLNNLLATHTKNFMEGMDYLVLHQRMAPDESFRAVIRYILTRPDVKVREFEIDPAAVDGYYDLTERGVLQAEQLYELDLEQMDRIAGEAAAEVFLDERGRDVRAPILDLFHRREGLVSSWELKEQMDVTQRAAERLKRRLTKTRGNVTRLVLSFLLKELEPRLEAMRASGDVPDQLEIPLGRLDAVHIPLSDIPPEKRFGKLERFVAAIRRMHETIELKGMLSPEQTDILLSLSGEYPQINRFKALSGANLEEEIAAVNRGIDFLFNSLDLADPMAQAKKRFLLRLAESPAGLLGFQSEGETVTAFWQPTVKLYAQGEARVGPYTFYESALARVSRRGVIRYEPAMAYVDRRGRAGHLTLSDFEGFLRFEEKLKSLAGNGTEGEGLLQSYQRFLTDVKRAWASVQWEDERARNVAMGKDRRQWVARGALNFRALAPGFELVRQIRETSRELLESRVYDGLRTESIYLVLSRLTKRFGDFFTEKPIREAFTEQMKLLAERIAEGNENGVMRQRAILKDIFFRQMDRIIGQELGRLAANVKTVAWGEEVRGWSELMRRPSSEIGRDDIERLAMFRINQGVPPSLKNARNLWGEGNMLGALNEFGRIAIDGRTDISTRLTALVDLFRVSFAANDIIWMNKAIGELDYLLAANRWHLKPEQVAMMQLALRLEDAGILKLGSVLREALQSYKPPEGEGSGGGVGREHLSKPAFVPAINRAASLEEAPVAKVLRVIRNIYGADVIERYRLGEVRDIEELEARLKERLEERGMLRGVEETIREKEKTETVTTVERTAMCLETLMTRGVSGTEEAAERGRRRLLVYRHNRRVHWERRPRGPLRGGESGEERKGISLWNSSRERVLKRMIGRGYETGRPMGR